MKKISRALLALAAIISLAVGFMGQEPVTPESSAVWWHGIPAFFAFFGFGGALLITFVAKGLGGLFLQKREDYYDAE